MNGTEKKDRQKRAAQTAPSSIDRRTPRSPSGAAPQKPLPAGAPESIDSRNKITLIVLSIIIAAVIAYSNLYRNDFINFDDNLYITENAHVKSGLSLEGVKWAFDFEEKEGIYWHPFTWLALMGIHRLFGLSSTAFHLANLFIHILNSLLLLFILKRMTGSIWPSAFVAMLFALHPLNVESVAWAVEIKTVSSTLFGLLTIYLYISYVGNRDAKRYAAALTCFCVSLMFKPMLVTLPFVLLLLDWWPLGRVVTSKGAEARLSRFKALVIEKVPFVLLSVFSVAIAVLSLKHLSRIEETSYPGLAYRLENAVVSYAVYMFKMILPTNLAVFYPNPPAYAVWKPAGAVMLLLSGSFLVTKSARKRPYLLVGWLWYLAVLFPMIGLVRAGLWPQIADRFTYVPMMGLFIMTAWGIPELLNKWQPTRFPTPRKETLFALSALILLSLSIVTRTQVGYWRNSIALYDHSLKSSPSDLSHYNRGTAYSELGNQRQAISDFDRAIEINPNLARAYNNRGTAYGKLGNHRQAISDFDRAIEIKIGRAHV